MQAVVGRVNISVEAASDRRENRMRRKRNAPRVSATSQGKNKITLPRKRGKCGADLSRRMAPLCNAVSFQLVRCVGVAIDYSTGNRGAARGVRTRKNYASRALLISPTR